MVNGGRKAEPYLLFAFERYSLVERVYHMRIGTQTRLFAYRIAFAISSTSSLSRPRGALLIRVYK